VLGTFPVAQSRPAMTLFVSAAIITATVLFWTQYFLPKGGGGLSLIFLTLFADLDHKAASFTIAILLIAASLRSGPSYCSRVLEWISNHMLSVAAATVPLLSAGTLFVYRNHPLAMDEYAQYLQSQVFAAGHLAGNFPPPLMDWLVPPGFQNYFLSISKSTGAVASGYWPSFALLMSPFTALGVPWACNPVISAMTLLAAHRLSLKIYGDRSAAAMVVLLIAASPEFFVNGISYYSMPAHLLANTVYALLLLEPTRSKLFLAGIVGSIALTLHNPFPHLLFALPWILWVSHRPDGNRMTLWLLAGYVPLCVLLGLGWFWFTGHLRSAGMHAPGGAGDLAGMWRTLSVFSLPDSSVMLARMIGIAKICVWSAPCMVVLAVAGAWKGWSQPGLRLLTLSALLTLLGYFIVPVDQGHGWGYRYFHTAWIALPILAAGALTKFGTQEGRFVDEGSRAFVVTCAMLMLVIGGGFYAAQVRKFMTFDLAQAPGYLGTERRVVLVNPSFGFYSADLVQNDPWLRGSVIRMLSHGRDADAQMMAQNFPGMHRVYQDPHGTVWSMASSIP